MDQLYLHFNTTIKHLPISHQHLFQLVILIPGITGYDNIEIYYEL